MTTTATRSEALGALLAGNPGEEGPAPARPLTVTGLDVYAGGTLPRLLVAPAVLAYRTPDGVLEHAEATVGDTVLVDEEQAARLDRLGVTAPAGSTPQVTAPGAVTDEELAAMGAADVIAWAGQHPADRPRIHALEAAKRPSKQRATVLEATNPATA